MEKIILEQNMKKVEGKTSKMIIYFCNNSMTISSNIISMTG